MNTQTSKILNKKTSSSGSRVSKYIPQSDKGFPDPGRYIIRKKNLQAIKFAISKRPTFFQITDNPAPGSYNIPSSFNKGNSFSFSPKLSKSAPKYPAPTHYDVKYCEPSSPKAVFGKEKRKDNFLNKEQLNVPDPGKYSLRNTLQGPK